MIPLKIICIAKKVHYETTKEIGCAETKVTHKSLSPEHTPHSLLHHSTVSYCPLVLQIRVTVSTLMQKIKLNSGI